MAELPTTCPKCGGALVDGACLFDGPLSEILATMQQPSALVELPETGAVAQKKVHAGWKGYDRDLGAKKRAERAAEAVAVEERSKLPARLWAALGTVLSVAVVGGVAFLWQSGALESPIPPAPETSAPLPQKLTQAPSAARGDLVLLARALDELAVDAEARVVGNSDVAPATLDRFAVRLDGLHDSLRALESRLTREETRILMSLQQAERDIATWLGTYRGAAPEFDGGRLQNARDNVGRALVLARGGELESAVKVYARKASAAQQLQELELGR